MRPQELEDGDLKPGHWYCLEEEVQEIRQRLLAQGIAPRIAMKDETHSKSMSYRKCVANVLPPHWKGSRAGARSLEFRTRARGCRP